MPFQQQIVRRLQKSIQLSIPFSYLGYELLSGRVFLPRLELQISSLKTLHDFQRLLGNLQFLHLYLKISPDTMLPLYDLLKGDSHPLSPQELTIEAHSSLQKIENAINSQTSAQIHNKLSLFFVVCATPHSPLGAFWQSPVIPHSKIGSLLFGVSLPSSPSKVLVTYSSLVAQLVSRGCKLSCMYFAKDPNSIIVPFTTEQVDWLF